MTKPTKWHVRPAKTQISLGIRPVWSESSLSAIRKLGSLATHGAHSKDSDQTGHMPRLNWIFAGSTCHFVGFVMRRLICLRKCYVNVYLLSWACEDFQWEITGLSELLDQNEKKTIVWYFLEVELSNSIFRFFKTMSIFGPMHFKTMGYFEKWWVFFPWSLPS